MRQVYMTLKSETPGLEGSEFGVPLWIPEDERQPIHVLMDDDLLDITDVLTPKQKADVLAKVQELLLTGKLGAPKPKEGYVN